MQEGEIALIDEFERALEHRFRLGRKACDNIGTERDIRPQPLDLCAEFNGVLARMPALHPLEDQIVA